MKIADKIREAQDTKEMTRRTIKILESLGQDVEKEKAAFFDLYQERI